MTDKGMAEGKNWAAAVTESSPNLFTKVAEVANRLRNKKKALHQATLFMEEVKATEQEGNPRHQTA